ncbi:MAG: AAA family ATPase [Alphaproteobacteria bacterium]|nr:AAA family ATPase [Alphaproteobacteria bacterium]
MTDLDALAAGGKPALARALAAIERDPDGDVTLALLDAAHARRRAAVVGITGPPGVGKSTLLGALTSAWRAGGRRVGVVAVDPSSRASGGALLGDRARIATDPNDAGVFVRSLAARDRLGGLAELAMPAVTVLAALYDIVVVETVGVGQSETEIADLADTLVLCVQPGAGDSLQYMKAGVAETPDIAVVTKADLGPAAARAAADLKAGLSLAAPGQWRVPVLLVAAPRRDGIDALTAAIDRHQQWLDGEGRRARRRALQARHWLEQSVRDRFGREGLKRCGSLDVMPGQSPFARYREIVAELLSSR